MKPLTFLLTSITLLLGSVCLAAEPIVAPDIEVIPNVVTFRLTFSDTLDGPTADQKANAVADALIGLYGQYLPVDDPETEEDEGADSWSKLKKARVIQRALWLRDVKRWQQVQRKQQYVDSVEVDETAIDPVE